MEKSYIQEIQKMADRLGIQLIYVFGSRQAEITDLLEGKMDKLSGGGSDLDIGIKAAAPLSVEDKVETAIFFEDLFDIPRVDIVVLDEAPVFLAFEIVTGALLFSRDDDLEANYQLYIMAQAADLKPFQQMKIDMVLGKMKW